jgi:transposase
VVLLHRQKMSRRAIARALHISRNTVRRILARQSGNREAPHSALPAQVPRSRPSKLDSFRPQVDELLRTYVDITAQRIYEELKGKGFSGAYTGVKDLVRRIRPKPKPEPSLQTAPRVPGDMGECDWSPYDVTFTHAPPATLQAFGYTLRYSTRKFFSFHEGNGLHPLMDGHTHAFERFGGAALRCKYDSQKPVVLRWEGQQPIYNPRFVDFATYYEFLPVACRRRKPNDKPRVERSFYELVLSFFRGRSFRDFADLKAQLTLWLDTICDARPLKRMKRRTRMELFAEEQPLLQPLPRHHYDTARVVYKLCDLAGFIAWESNRYSLPYDYVTDILPVRVTETELFIYRADLKCIAQHPLLPRGAQLESILEGHRPKDAGHGPNLDQLRVAFAAIDEKAAAFLVALEKASPRSAAYHARNVLAMRERWNTDELVRALEHARAFGALEHGSIERILMARASPRRLDEYVAEATARKLERAVTQSCTEPRDLTEYDALPCRGSTPLSEGDAPCPAETAPEQPQSPPAKSERKSSDTSSGLS